MSDERRLAYDQGYKDGYNKAKEKFQTQKPAPGNWWVLCIWFFSFLFLVYSQIKESQIREENSRILNSEIVRLDNRISNLPRDTLVIHIESKQIENKKVNKVKNEYTKN